MSAESNVKELLLQEVLPHPKNPRVDLWDAGAYEELRRSIEEHGVTNMPIVRWVEDLDCYQILSGHRRIKACRDLGMMTVTCVVRDLDEREALLLMMSENMHRCDLNPIEEGAGFKVLCEELEITSEELAQKLGCSKRKVLMRQELLNLGDEAQEQVKTGKLSLGVAQVILHLPPALRVEGEERILEEQSLFESPMTVTQAEDYLEHGVLEPYKAKLEWEELRETHRKAHIFALGGMKLPEMDEINVRAMDWNEKIPRDAVEAAHNVPWDQKSEFESPANLRWVHLAQRHNVPILVYRSQRGEALAMVSRDTLVAAERAYYDARLQGEEMLRNPDLSPAMKVEAKTLCAMENWLAVTRGASVPVATNEREREDAASEEPSRSDLPSEDKEVHKLQSLEEFLKKLLQYCRDRKGEGFSAEASSSEMLEWADAASHIVVLERLLESKGVNWE